MKHYLLNVENRLGDHPMLRSEGLSVSRSEFFSMLPHHELRRSHNMADDTFKLETASPVSNMNEMAIDNILARFFKSNGWIGDMFLRGDLN